jgi:hypothetical protein
MSFRDRAISANPRESRIANRDILRWPFGAKAELDYVIAAEQNGAELILCDIIRRKSGVERAPSNHQFPIDFRYDDAAKAQVVEPSSVNIGLGLP